MEGNLQTGLAMKTISAEERKAEIALYIEQYAAAWAAASPAEREIEMLERKTRLSPDELARLRDLRCRK